MDMASSTLAASASTVSAAMGAATSAAMGGMDMSGMGGTSEGSHECITSVSAQRAESSLDQTHDFQMLWTWQRVDTC